MHGALESIEVVLILMGVLYFIMLFLSFKFQNKMLFALSSLLFLGIIPLTDSFIIQVVCIIIVFFHFIILFVNNDDEY